MTKPTKSESTAEQSPASKAAVTRRVSSAGDVSLDRNVLGKVAAKEPAERPEAQGQAAAIAPQEAVIGAAVAGKSSSRAAPYVDDGGVEAAPARLETARVDGPDDLKLIWGVGPRMESLLHSMGFYHFDQIAGWTDENLRWVDRRLDGFKGRARRDDWIGQAKKLAGGWRPASKLGDQPAN